MSTSPRNEPRALNSRRDAPCEIASYGGNELRVTQMQEKTTGTMKLYVAVGMAIRRVAELSFLPSALSPAVVQRHIDPILAVAHTSTQSPGPVFARSRDAWPPALMTPRSVDGKSRPLDDSIVRSARSSSATPRCNERASNCPRFRCSLPLRPIGQTWPWPHCARSDLSRELLCALTAGSLCAVAAGAMSRLGDI